MPPNSLGQIMSNDAPQHRYDAHLANEIESRWQQRWEDDHTYWAPNPAGPLADTDNPVASRPKVYAMDMFPYPSGVGLHVGHPLGYIGTDVFARFMRMTGHNVLHPMGFDAFGLPAEQYAVQTGQHPRITTEANVENMRRQLKALGLGYDWRRSISTTDPTYYRWTQWIFLQMFNAWYDDETARARPVEELVAEFEEGSREPIGDANPHGLPWPELDELAQRRVVDSYRLAYLSESPVNWCPGLGTVLANEEVTADGRSERGNFPVYRRPMKQWMLRITAYGDRLLDDLAHIDWPEPIKLMQRNWIGRSTGTSVKFPVALFEDTSIEVYTTRPDTLFGATYMVLAPEHPLVDHIVPNEWPGDWEATNIAWRGLYVEDQPPDAVRRYQEFASRKSDLERQVEAKEKTGVFTGAYAINPVSGEPIPIFIADYVLMGYGTGAIMAVPAHDERDFEFARAFQVPITKVVEPPASWFESLGIDPSTPADQWPEAYSGDGLIVNSSNDDASLDGLDKASAMAHMTAWLESNALGRATTNYKLRDWLFSRQRYWGEPFPIVYDETGLPVALPVTSLPVELPAVTNFEPTASDDEHAEPEPPLGRAIDWTTIALDLPGESWRGYGGGPKTYTRELNTMPQWAGSCWYYLRYLDPTNTEAFVDPAVERYWMGGDEQAGGVDLYVGGVEHAVLHLLYARFWHKVLYDLGHVSTPEPFHRLVNQGMIQAYAYQDDRGMYVEASHIVERDGGWYLDDQPVSRSLGKMGKSLKNAVSPDEIFADYGADTLRLYEMFQGPLSESRPWNMSDIIGVYRFLQRLWRNVIDEGSGEARVHDAAPTLETQRMLHRTIESVRNDMGELGFNTAIAHLFSLNNHLTQVAQANGAISRSVIEPMILMVAPLAPHVAEELWHRLGHEDSVVWQWFPVADPQYLVVDEIEYPVQVNGKVRSRITVAADADDTTVVAIALTDEKVVGAIAGKEIVKQIVVPRRLVNLVVR